jgi:erythromycin esterase-like protein
MAFDEELSALISSNPPRLLALGEPTHIEPAFLRLRNEMIGVLAGHGFRAVAVESDRVAGLAVDDYVQGRADSVDLTTGFSHSMGHLAGNRELVELLRANRMAFHGFDAPVEMMSAPSPAPYLRHVRDYLGVPADGLDELAGDDSRWSDSAAIMEATRSPGRSPEAAALRALADDLQTLLYADAPRLIERTSRTAWQRANVHATAALGLLRYHATAAEQLPRDERIFRLLAVRDALMARNLLEILAETDGPVLVCAHNRHLQRQMSTWQLAGMDLQWQSAGSIVAALTGGGYVFVAGSLGESPALGMAPPEAGSYEASMPSGLISPGQVHGTARVNDEPRYFPLDAGTVAGCDAILHVATGDDPVDEFAARVLALPGVAMTRIEPDSGMPDYTLDDRFFFAGEDRMRPFATIVRHDIPDFDVESDLNRPYAFRLNIELGRDEFRRVFGFGPEELAAKRADIDFAAPDRFVPHPAYGVQGWGSVVNPGPATAAEIDRLLEYARARSLARTRPKP